MRKVSNLLLIGSGQFFLQLEFLDLPLCRDGFLMRTGYALFCRERDVVAWFQRLLRRLYAYRQFLSFAESFIGHDVKSAHAVMRAFFS